MVLDSVVMSIAGWGRSAGRALLGVGLIYLTAGCAVVVVHFELDVEVGGRDANGRAWRAGPESFMIKTRAAGEPPSHSDTQYQGKVFHGSFGAGVAALGGTIRTKIPTPVCFRFDETRLSSNLHEQEIPMRLIEALYFLPTGQVISIRNKKGDTTLFSAPVVCFADKSRSFSLAPDLSELFPSGRMFNISWAENDKKSLAGGIGNWVKIRVPIEYEGKREELEIKLTATDQKAVTRYQSF